MELAPYDRAHFVVKTRFELLPDCITRSSSVPLRTQPSCQLKAYQLFKTQHLNLTIIVISSHCQFTLSITIQKHQLSLFEVIPPCTVLYFHGLVAYSFVQLNYLVHWTTVSALPVLIYFDDTLLDRSEDVIVVTEEGAKEVKKPHIEVSPV